MNPILVFGTIAAYFSLLLLISYLTSRKRTASTFFTANRKSPWYLVAFGMIGASLSGVTFISVPGWVGNTAFSYFQMVLGYLPGYLIIALVLLPMYYKLNLVSIYTYLQNRFGTFSYKTGSGFFLLSRTIGASFRLFLVATVLQIAFFDSFGIPFYITILTTILLIYLYTFRAGIKTIVWTDTLQTFFMLLAVVISVIVIANELGWSFTQVFQNVKDHPYSKTFFWDTDSDLNFFKRFFAGTFIAIVMTGLDQDMMQKNLTCRNLKDAQKNILWLSLTLLPVNLLFLGLGVLLYSYVQHTGMVLTDASEFFFNTETGKYLNTDKLFPMLALTKLNVVAGLVFLLGVIAAAFSSADSAITSLTTAFYVDILDKKVDDNSAKATRTRRLVHFGISVAIFVIILLFNLLNNKSVIQAVFEIAGYTYGPLLGLFAFGLFTKLQVRDKLVPIVAIASPVISYIIAANSVALFGGYKFGFELLIINGLITFGGLLLINKGQERI